MTIICCTPQVDWASSNSWVSIGLDFIAFIISFVDGQITMPLVFFHAPTSFWHFSFGLLVVRSKFVKTIIKDGKAWVGERMCMLIMALTNRTPMWGVVGACCAMC